jgi:hypothetical protein
MKTQKLTKRISAKFQIREIEPKVLPACVASISASFSGFTFNYLNPSVGN